LLKSGNYLFKRLFINILLRFGWAKIDFIHAFCKQSGKSPLRNTTGNFSN
jgi:hypothetical protein